MNKKILTLLFSFIVLISDPIFSNDLYREHQIELQQIDTYSSPSQRFNHSTSLSSVEYKLNYYGATENNKSMFKQMMGNEKSGFIGYHAGCSDYRIFQDVIKIAIEEYLGIPIRHDFQFLRTPGIADFSFESADAFVAKHPTYHDDQAPIKKHILSINIPLYNSWFADWDFSPRYFLQNKPWTHVYFETELSPFFKKIGIDTKHIGEIFQLARQYVPQNKGMILQFFDRSHNVGLIPYAFLDEQAFVGTSGSKIPDQIPSDLYLNSSSTRFPQLRMVMNNTSTLNPNSPLSMIRYQTMTPANEDLYEETLREFMRSVPYNAKKAESFRNELLKYWY